MLFNKFIPALTVHFCFSGKKSSIFNADFVLSEVRSEQIPADGIDINNRVMKFVNFINVKLLMIMIAIIINSLTLYVQSSGVLRRDSKNLRLIYILWRV